MGAARLNRRQRGGEGCGKKGGKRKKISGGKNTVVEGAADYEREGVTREARGESRGAFKILLVEEAVRAVR